MERREREALDRYLTTPPEGPECPDESKYMRELEYDGELICLKYCQICDFQCQDEPADPEKVRCNSCYGEVPKNDIITKQLPNKDKPWTMCSSCWKDYYDAISE